MPDFKKYMKNNFPKLELEGGLFYKWKYGIRFEIGYQDKIVLDSGELNKLYFDLALSRVKEIFEFIFQKEDNIFVVCKKFCNAKRKINKNNFCYKNINYYFDVKKYKISTYSGEKYLKKIHWEELVFYTKVKYINYKHFLFRSIWKDFGYGGGMDVYFINIDKNIIFYNYDDRGLDVLSSNVENLRPLYKKFNNYILDYDREKIDRLFIS